MYVRMYVCMYGWMDGYMYVAMYVYALMMYIHKCMHTGTYMHAYMNCSYMCMCTHIRTMHMYSTVICTQKLVTCYYIIITCNSYHNCINVYVVMELYS